MDGKYTFNSLGINSRNTLNFAVTSINRITHIEASDFTEPMWGPHQSIKRLSFSTGSTGCDHDAIRLVVDVHQPALDRIQLLEGPLGGGIPVGLDEDVLIGDADDLGHPCLLLL